MKPPVLQKISIGLLLALTALCLTWELWLAPVRPGGSWLVLKTLPLLLPLRGLLHGRRYTFQWLTLLVWIYFTEGVVRASSDSGRSVGLAMIEAIIALGLFSAAAAYARLTAPSRAPSA